jgi:transcriptional regulator with XRE-family HTH domain
MVYTCCTRNVDDSRESLVQVTIESRLDFLDTSFQSCFWKRCSDDALPGSSEAREMFMLETPRIQITLEPAIRQLSADFGLTGRELAQALGVDQRTVARWSAGDAFPRQGAKDRLEALAALDERLDEMFVSWDAARAWLRAPTRYLSDMAPIDAVRAGRSDGVLALVEAIDSGFAS